MEEQPKKSDENVNPDHESSDSESIDFNTDTEVKLDADITSEHDGDYGSPQSIYNLMERKRKEASFAAVTYVLAPLSSIYIYSVAHLRNYSPYLINFHVLQSILLFILFWIIVSGTYFILELLNMPIKNPVFFYWLPFTLLYILIIISVSIVTFKAAKKEIRNYLPIIGKLTENFVDGRHSFEE